MNNPSLKVNEDLLNVLNIEYFPSGSLSSFQASIVYSEGEDDFGPQNCPQHLETNIIKNEQNSMKLSTGSKAEQVPRESFENALKKAIFPNAIRLGPIFT